MRCTFCGRVFVTSVGLEKHLALGCPHANIAVSAPSSNPKAFSSGECPANEWNRPGASAVEAVAQPIITNDRPDYSDMGLPPPDLRCGFCGEQYPSAEHFDQQWACLKRKAYVEQKGADAVPKPQANLYSYIALLRRHLAGCPIDAAVCSSCKFVRQMLAEAEKVETGLGDRRFDDNRTFDEARHGPRCNVRNFDTASLGCNCWKAQIRAQQVANHTEYQRRIEHAELSHLISQGEMEYREQPTLRWMRAADLIQGAGYCKTQQSKDAAMNAEKGDK